MAKFPPESDGYTWAIDPARSPNGMNSVPPGVASDDGSRDPSATTVAGAMANASAQMAEMQSDAVTPAGSWIGDMIDLPPKNY